MSRSNRFENLKKDPAWWYKNSCNLRLSAGVLWLSMNDKYKKTFSKELGLGEDYDLSGSCSCNFHMLSGLSFELLFKSIIIKHNQDIPKTHNLIQLSSQAGYIASNDEKKIFDLLSDYVKWAGKYPIPNDENENELFYKKLGNTIVTHYQTGNVFTSVYNGSLEWDSLNYIWSSIERLYY